MRVIWSAIVDPGAPALEDSRIAFWACASGADPASSKAKKAKLNSRGRAFLLRVDAPALQAVASSYVR